MSIDNTGTNISSSGWGDELLEEQDALILAEVSQEESQIVQQNATQSETHDVSHESGKAAGQKKKHKKHHKKHGKHQAHDDHHHDHDHEHENHTHEHEHHSHDQQQIELEQIQLQQNQEQNYQHVPEQSPKQVDQHHNQSSQGLFEHKHHHHHSHESEEGKEHHEHHHHDEHGTACDHDHSDEEDEHDHDHHSHQHKSHYHEKSGNVYKPINIATGGLSTLQKRTKKKTKQEEDTNDIEGTTKVQARSLQTQVVYENYKETSESLLMYITVLASFAIVECMIGLSHSNVHIVRDCLNVFLMLAALVFSSKALQLSLKPRDDDYPFGYVRFNILAAFVNSVYLLFSFVFSFVDNLHHMVEHWESEQHTSEASKLIGGEGNSSSFSNTTSPLSHHDDIAHLKEVNQYLTLFTFLKMVILGSYLYFESRDQDVTDYMQVNWLGWPQGSNQVTPANKQLLKQKVAQCNKWHSFRLNTYSISLLIACEFINCFGNIWVYYVCINFGILENLLSLIKGLVIVVLAVPLCLDICYTLLQKVNPYQLVALFEEKLKSISYIEGVVAVKKWHLWCLDKSHRICTLHIEAREDADPDTIRAVIEKKLMNKYCENLAVHITQ